ncbi:MAG: UvrD-helicase domain-containing protein [Planctomycetota bacterium]|nr:UvrD-helicase domain-containing protein [Planctomycetota bacterium]
MNRLSTGQGQLFPDDDEPTDAVAVAVEPALKPDSNETTGSSSRLTAPTKPRFENRLAKPMRDLESTDQLRLSPQEVGEEQLRNVVIRASAGTGKTFQLSNRYLAQLHAGAAPDEILATTFTRKAAGEILERILIRLAEAASSDQECHELAKHIGANPKSLNRSRCMQMLKTVTLSLHRLRVSTLDSFFSQIASTFGLELGLPTGWRIIDDLADHRLREQAIEIVLGQDSAQDVSRLMNLLTKGAAQRSVSQLLHSTVNSLYQTFLETTADAWRQFPDLPLLTAENLDEVLEELRTVELPKHKNIAEARDRDYAAAASYQWEEFVKVRGIGRRVEEGADTYYKKPIEPEVRAIYQRLLGHVRAALLDLLAKQTGATHDLLDRFHAVYDRLKREARAMRFDDVTRKVSEAGLKLRTSQLTYRLDARIQHLLLDEFQDTSLSQWRVLRPFARQVTSPKTKAAASVDPLEARLILAHATPEQRRSFFCVGDVKQAIYGWRGGVAEIFDAIETELHGTHRESLNLSYRSSPPVVDAVNEIFTNIRKHEFFASVGDGVLAWLDRFEPHSTARTELAGYVCLESAPTPPDDGVSQQAATLRFAAERIAALTAECPGKSVGVLARRNHVVGRMIFELRRLDVPASEDSGNPLTDSAAVEVVLSLLQVADHPGDLTARFHVATSPLGVELGFLNHADDNAANRLSLEVRAGLINGGYGATVGELARKLARSCNRRDWSRLNQLVELAYGFQANATLRTRDFVNFVRTQRIADPTSDDVRVMTIHQAKGLEFDIVVLVDLDGDLTGQTPSFVTGQPSPTEPSDRVCLYRNVDVQRMLPDRLRESFEQTRDRHLTEGLCVMYVALTRAVHALHMIVAPSTPSERTVPQTSAGLFRAALTDGTKVEPRQVLYEQGDRDWIQRAENPAAAAALILKENRVPDEKLEPIRIQLADSDNRRRGMKRESPSGREGGRTVKLSNILRTGNAAAMGRGTLMHAWFELVQWLDDGRWPEESRLRQVADEIGASGLNVDRLIHEFQEMLRSPKIAWTLYRKSYDPPRDLGYSAELLQEIAAADLRLDVQNERPFAIREGNSVVSGIIDRLVLIYDNHRLIAADIVDYKTDSVSTSNPQALRERVDHYRAQLETYRPAVARIYRIPVERVSARLLMVSAGIVVPV